MKINKDVSKQVTKVQQSNRYQIPHRNDSEEEISARPDKTPSITTTTSSQNTSSRNKNITKNHKYQNIETTATETINEIINEFLADEKSELREINRTCSRITERLKFQHQCNMEDLLLKYKQRIIKMESINNDCHQLIGELVTVTDNPPNTSSDQLDVDDTNCDNIKNLTREELVHRLKFMERENHLLLMTYQPQYVEGSTKDTNNNVPTDVKSKLSIKVI